MLLRLGWTWQQYLDTPDLVIELLRIVLKAEAETQREKTREMESEINKAKRMHR